MANEHEKPPKIDGADREMNALHRDWVTKHNQEVAERLERADAMLEAHDLLLSLRGSDEVSDTASLHEVLSYLRAKYEELSGEGFEKDFEGLGE